MRMIDISRVQTDRAGVKNNSKRRQMTKTNGHRRRLFTGK